MYTCCIVLAASRLNDDGFKKVKIVTTEKNRRIAKALVSNTIHLKNNASETANKTKNCL